MKTEPRRVEPLLARLSVKIPLDASPDVEERPPDRPPGTLYTLIARETTDVVPKDRAEQGQPADVMPPAECRYGVAVDRDVWAHGFSHHTAEEANVGTAKS